VKRRTFLIAAALIPGGLKAMPESKKVTFSNPEGVAPPIGKYSHIAVVPKNFDLIVLAGQIGNEPNGNLPAEVERQYENALTNIVKLLQSQGCTPSDIVKINSYLVKPLDPEKVKGVRQRILGPIAPPSTMVYVSQLATPQLLIEIEVWAARRST
jgi:2-iminobutanoate/2-iminopropanoate deaminase